MAAIECPHCGTHVEIYDDTTVRNGHQQSTQHKREWLIIEDGKAVHRCDGESVRAK